MVKTFNISILLLTILLSSCYQKNAKQHDGKPVDDTEIEDELAVGADTIQFVDTFNMLTVSEIYPQLKRILKAKLVIQYPEIEQSDSLKIHEQFELLALANVYANWADVTINKKMIVEEIENSLTLLGELVHDSLTSATISTVDSLNSLTDLVLAGDDFISQNVYFESIQWLEILHVTLSAKQNTKNNKKYEELIREQLNKGSELLNRLYAYQEYKPIADFSQEILEVLECKHYQFNVTQLHEMVIGMRSKLLEHWTEEK